MRVDGALVCPAYTGRLAGKFFHPRGRLRGHVSLCRGSRGRAEHGEEERVCGITNELRAGICCHASGYEESRRKYSHGYTSAPSKALGMYVCKEDWGTVRHEVGAVRERTLKTSLSYLDFKSKSNIVYINIGNFPFFIYYLAVSLLISNGA